MGGASATVSSRSRSAATPRKRSRDDALRGKLDGTQANQATVVHDTENAIKPKKQRNKKSAPGEEKRLKLFRKKAPFAWLGKLERAQTQRMFVLNRDRSHVGGVPQEVIELAGSTGNVYNVTITRVPSCTCPDFAKNGGQCKHIIYALHFVLKAPEDLQYQAAFLSSELRQILDSSPLPQLDHDHADDDSNRKPVDGDCPICFMDLDPATEEIVWCKAACGNNIHKECFEKWAKSSTGMAVRCVYCRTEWKGDEPSLERIRSVREGKTVNQEGYVNLASELGISTYRDTSTYHRFWVNRQHRNGHSFDTF